MSVEERNKELVRKIFQGLNDRKVEIFTELYTPEYCWHFPSNNPESMSREEELDFVKTTWAGFPDLTYNVEEMIAADNRVTARFVTKGTHKGEFQGIPATMKKFESGGMIVLRITDGQVVEAREEFDMVGMMQQLGMELQPAAN